MRTGRWHRLRRAAGSPVTGALLLLLALATWALASPVGASPDEDFHLTSAWCGLGERDGACAPGPDPAQRVVPEALLQAPCFAFHSDVGATCQGTRITDPDGSMVPTTRGNFTGDYPPVFFAVMGIFVGPDIVASVLLMRVFNALLLVLVAGATYWLATPPVRRALVVGAGVTLVPLGMFIVPSINPSSWAVTSALTTFLAAVVHMTAPTRRRLLGSGTLVALAVLMGAGARADAAVFAALGVGAALLVTFRPTRDYALRLPYPVLLALASTASFFAAGQSSAVEGAGAQPFSVSRLVQLFSDVPELWVGALGKWGLGWLDTPLPPAVWVTMSGLFAAAVLTGVRGMGRMHALALGGAVAAAWVIPAYLQYLTGHPVGAYVQPRYILPLLVLVVLVAVTRLSGPGFRLSPAQRWLVVGAVGLANALALYNNVRRYVTGDDVQAVNLSFQQEWWWSGWPLGPMATWFVGAAAFAAALVILSRELVHDGPAADAVGAAGPLTCRVVEAPADGPGADHDRSTDEASSSPADLGRGRAMPGADTLR